MTELPASKRTCAPMRAKSRGFTLIELMTVVVMIGILLALGIPTIGAQMRDRRTNQAAHEVALLYRQARSVAMGRGAAVLVRFDTTNRGVITVLQALNPGDDVTTCLRLPATSCNANPWDVASSLTVAKFDPADLHTYDNVKLTFHNLVGTDAEGDVCFSPLGRPYWRNVHVGTQNFLPLTEVPQIEVAPIDGIGLTRTVLVLPTGASRLAL